MVPTINTGLSPHTQQEIVNSLNKILANTYVLYVKTQGFHWNVTGPEFHSLHELFEEQYQALASAVDELAERTRALGAPALGSMAEFIALASLKEASGHLSGKDMIKQLLLDHESLTREIRASFALADQEEDEATVDLFTERMAYHEKQAWMLRSLLVA